MTPLIHVNPIRFVSTAITVLLVYGSCSCQKSSVGMRKDSERLIVAMVGDEPIYLDDFKRVFDRVRLDKNDVLPTTASQKVHRRALLDDLIDRRLLLAEAEAKHVFVGTDEVEGAFGRSRAGWTEADFGKELQNHDLTPAELKDELREMLTIRAYFREHVFSRIAVTDAEIAQGIASETEAPVLPELVRARQIVVKTEAEAQSIAKQIRKGKPFGDAAMKYSLSPDAASGGDLGFFPRGAMPKPFDETCFSLEVGAVSEVIASPSGFHLFQVVDRRAAQPMSDEQVRGRAEERLRDEKERQARAKKLAELRAAVQIVIEEVNLAQVL